MYHDTEPLSLIWVFDGIL